MDSSPANGKSGAHRELPLEAAAVVAPTTQQKTLPTQRPQSGFSKESVLPPIGVAPETVNVAPPAITAPAQSTQAKPPITNGTIEAFLEQQRDLLKHLIEAPDKMTNSQKYEMSYGSLSYGTLRRDNPELENRLKLAHLFADEGLFDFVITTWRMLNITDPLHWTRMNSTRSEYSKCLNFYYLLTPIWNGTDLGDSAVMKKFGDVLFDFYMKILDSPALLTVSKVLIQSRIINALLGTLHNFVHKYNDGISLIREKEGVRIIGLYTSHHILSVKTKAILVLSYIITEGEQNKLEVTDAHIKYIIDVLADCVKGDTSRHYSRKYGYEAEEILVGLNHMAVADANKAGIVKCGALPLYAALLMDDCDLKEQTEACKGIWMLAFNNENRRKILDQVDCMEGLRHLARSSDNQVKRAAEGALWAIEGESDRVQQTMKLALSESTPAVDSHAHHLMLSYNWGVQGDVLKIKDKLKASGYKVWIDVEQMSGSTLDAMAKSIEEASVVLIFFTEQYKKSPNCRSEAEYCYKIQKPFIPIRMQTRYNADGWLGIILGTRLFYDFTKTDSWEPTFLSLCKGIDQVSKGAEGIRNFPESTAPDITDTALKQSALQLHTVASAKAVPPLAASQWTEAEVKSWLIQNGLQSNCQRFTGFSGLHLVELRQALFVAPTYFYDALKCQLELPLHDALAFTKILRELQ